jgi:MYXO-CTERM domain-containing protein
MKKLKMTFAVMAICGLLGMSQPVKAQDDVGDRTATTAMDRDDDDEDEGKWGLAGLLGLLGLLGLRKRDNDVRYTGTTTGTGTTTRRND